MSKGLQIASLYRRPVMHGSSILNVSQKQWNEQTILDRVYPSQDITGMDKVGVLDGDTLI